jgi:hypothetical protein
MKERSADMTGIDSVIPEGDMFRSKTEPSDEHRDSKKSYNVNYRSMLELPEFNVTVVGRGTKGYCPDKALLNRTPFIVLYDSLKMKRQFKDIFLRITSEDTLLTRYNGTGLIKKVALRGKVQGMPGLIYDY